MTRSRKEAEAAGVKTSDTKHSMKRRLPSHDYNAKGTYMLTLVVEGRKPLLGRLVVIPGEEPLRTGAKPPGTGAEPPGTGGSVRAHIELTTLGKAIRDEEIRKIAEHYSMVEVWKVCIMPDHIHIIVRVKEEMPKGKNLGQMVWGFKVGCTKAWWRIGFTPVPVGSSTGERSSLFEPGYNDKILLRDGQLGNWKHYLDDNPRRLAIKRLNPDLFKVVGNVFLIDSGGYSNAHSNSGGGAVTSLNCQMIGNRFLLDIPQKMAVIVHSGYTDKEYADWRQQWLACGEAGGVLVSAAIASREKEVMREAMDRGYSIILLRENGFPPFYKPSGEAFDACSSGQLLQISPWEYHMQRKTISREQCLRLNRMAEQIANGTITISL